MKHEHDVPLKDVGKFLPGRPHYTTVLRLVRRGTKTPAGRIRLAASSIGDRWYSSRAAAEQFVREVTAAKLGQPVVVDPRAAAARKAELARVLA